MKKIYSLLAAVSLALLFTVSAFAAVIAQNGGTAGGNVYAIYREKLNEIYRTEVKDGKAAVTLPDGTEIAVFGASGESRMLVVMPIPKDSTEAWHWFESCMKNSGSDIRPFELYFIDENGARVSAPGSFTVTITTPDAFKAPIACSLATSGTVTKLQSKASKNKITFQADRGGYYIVAQKAAVKPAGTTESTRAATGETSETSGGRGGTNRAAKTGDNGTALWLLLFCFAGTSFAFTAVKKKKEPD